MTTKKNSKMFLKIMDEKKKQHKLMKLKNNKSLKNEKKEYQ